IPLHESERRHIARELDRRIARQHVLQEANPGLADTGLAIRQPDDVLAAGLRQHAEHRLAVRQRNTADEMHDRMLAAVGHGLTPRPGFGSLCGTADISAPTSWRQWRRRSRARSSSGRTPR